MYNFELIIRGRTAFEQDDPKFDIPVIEVSGIVLVKANEKDSGYDLPYVNREYLKYWFGRFTQGELNIEVRDVILIKVENFPRYPTLTKPHNRSKNRVTIAKIQETKRANG